MEGFDHGRGEPPRGWISTSRATSAAASLRGNGGPASRSRAPTVDHPYKIDRLGSFFRDRAAPSFADVFGDGIGKGGRESPETPSLTRPVVLLALLLALVGGARIWDLGEHSPAIDFYQFWVVAEVAGRDDVEDIYGEFDRVRIGQEYQRRASRDADSPLHRAAAKLWPKLTPLGTPFFYAVFRPLAGGSYDQALRRYRVLCWIALTAGLALLARVLSLSPPAMLIVLAVLTTIFEPLRADVRVGNVNQLQLVMLALYLWLGNRADHSRRQLAAGAALALAVAFKPNLGLIVPLIALSWALERRWQRLRLQGYGMIGGAAAAVATGMIAFGSVRVWGDWLRIVTTMPPAMIPLGAGNFGLDRLLYERFGIELDVA
ncbi:MAG: glycosyltransferase 87 family protein, partial [Candidatus Binatia bacterium]